MDMDMGTSTTSMATAMSTTASSMMSSTSSAMSADMDSMSMVMTFFTSARTSLYTTTWTPTNDGQYAGTCIFLIVLAVILRFILALRPVLEAHVWNDRARHLVHGQHHHHHDHQHQHNTNNNTHIEEQEDQQLATAKIGNTLARKNPVSLIVRDLGSRWSGWRVNSAAGRATYELVIAGIAYLLMLAVMTMNVGYFLSVLAGIWLGTFILGGAAADNQWSHC